MELRRPPSARRGLALALGLRPLLMAVWLAPLLALTPARVVLEATVVAPLGALEAGSEDALLVAALAVEDEATALLVAAAAGGLALWLWTLLWHAATVAWWHAGAASPARLAGLLRRGAGWLPAYLRLSLLALASLALGLSLVAAPLAAVVDRCRRAMNEVAMEWSLGLGLALLAAVVAAVWLVTLHAAWQLGGDARRSALRAWWRGLGAARSDLPRSLAVLGLWSVAAVGLAAAPLLLGAAAPVLRGGLAGALLSLAAGGLRGLCWLGLFLSFAPAEAPPPRPDRDEVDDADGPGWNPS